VPSRWPVRKRISSGCLIERPCALTDQALLFNIQLLHQKKKKDLIGHLQVGGVERGRSKYPPPPNCVFPCLTRLVSLSHPLSHHHLYRASTDMDEIRGSFSRLKKDLEHRLTGSKREPRKADVDGRALSYSHPRSDAEVTVGSGRDGNYADGQEVSESIPLHPSLRSRAVGHPTVCEHGFFGRCL
jgi:hypothetical protein